MSTRPDRAATAVLAGAAVLLAGGGTAVAAAQGSPDRVARCDARLAKIAERRGVPVAELEARVEARLTARVDAALAAGRISTTQAARLKTRIARGELCRSSWARPAATAALARRGMLRAAARFLGLSIPELRTELRGTSLAALAAEQGKSVDALESAMLAPANARLARAVGTGRLARARADRVLARLEALAERLVQKTFPAG